MAIEITEDDICGYDEDDVETGETIVYESRRNIHDKIKEMRDVKTHSNNNNNNNCKNSQLDDETRDTLQRIEQELLQLKVEDKSSKEYRRIHSLYEKISNAYNNNDTEKSEDNIKAEEEEGDGEEHNFSFDFRSIQRMTRLEQKISLLEEAVGFDIDQEENSSLNVISRINRLYSHLKLIKNGLKEGDEPHKKIIVSEDSSVDNSNTIRSFEQINKYSPYMDHIITRVETYSSLYDGMIENNLRLQQWDDKMDAIIRQQDRWINLLDRIDSKLKGKPPSSN